MSLFPLHNKIACSYLGECPKQGYEGEGYVWVTIEATKTAPSAPKSQACQTKGRMWGRRFMGCWYSDRSGGGIPRPPASRSHNNTALELYHPHHYHYHLYESQSNAKIIIMLHHEHHHWNSYPTRWSFFFILRPPILHPGIILINLVFLVVIMYSIAGTSFSF